MCDLPSGLPIVERNAVRVVVQVVAGAVLLFRTCELTLPELGYWWELPGGGIEDGESAAETAVRELGEETGIRVSVDQIGPPTWRRTSREYFYPGRLPELLPDLLAGNAVNEPFELWS